MNTPQQLIEAVKVIRRGHEKEMILPINSNTNFMVEASSSEPEKIDMNRGLVMLMNLDLHFRAEMSVPVRAGYEEIESAKERLIKILFYELYCDIQHDVKRLVFAMGTKFGSDFVKNDMPELIELEAKIDNLVEGGQ